LISPELLVIDGYLDSSDIEPVIDFPLDTVDFPAVIAYKERLFDMAYHRFVYFGSDPRFGEFCKQEAWWLDDYALFSAIRKQYPDHTWSDLPEEIREKEPSALAIFRKNYADIIEREQFLQYIFSIQWKSFRKKCHDCGIRLSVTFPSTWIMTVLMSGSILKCSCSMR
jgi:4-alpha-glucanotransferase